MSVEYVFGFLYSRIVSHICSADWRLWYYFGSEARVIWSAIWYTQIDPNTTTTTRLWIVYWGSFGKWIKSLEKNWNTNQLLSAALNGENRKWYQMNSNNNRPSDKTPLYFGFLLDSLTLLFNAIELVSRNVSTMLPLLFNCVHFRNGGFSFISRQV